jgi:hypothetical protein
MGMHTRPEKMIEVMRKTFWVGLEGEGRGKKIGYVGL